VTATTAGARRTDNAYSRFVVANHGAEYLVDDFIPNPQAAVLSPATVAALPSVAEADSFRVFGPVDDVGYNLVASPDGRAYGTGLSRPKVLRGRPDRWHAAGQRRERRGAAGTRADRGPGRPAAG
jgi:hypothetical protein